MKNKPGYSGPSFGGLVVAEDAGGTHLQGTSTPKSNRLDDYGNWQLRNCFLKFCTCISRVLLTSKIAKESAMTVSPSTNAGTYLIGFNLSNSVSKGVKDSLSFRSTFLHMDCLKL